MSGIGACTSCSSTAPTLAPKPGADPADRDGNGTVSVRETVRAASEAASEANRAGAPQQAGFAAETAAALLQLQEDAGPR